MIILTIAIKMITLIKMIRLIKMIELIEVSKIAKVLKIKTIEKNFISREICNYKKNLYNFKNLLATFSTKP